MCGKRAVVFHQGALGDFIIAASAVDELAQTGWFARIDFWSKPEHVSLLAEKSYPGQCHPYNSALVAALLHDSLWRAAVLPDFLVEADRIFIFGQSGSRLMAERLSERLSAKVSWIQSFPVEKEAREHVSDFIRRQFAGLDLPISGKPLALSAPVWEKWQAQALLGHLGIDSKPIFVHPGSGGKRKVWPLTNWCGLLDWIDRELSARALLSVGPADEYMFEFSSAMGEAGTPVVSGLTLPGLSGLLSLCGLYIGSDSGVSHLAAAVGVPTISVFGPSDPRIWAPRGSRAIAVRRKWEEEEVLKWAPSQTPVFQDEQIIAIIKSLLTADGKVQTGGGKIETGDGRSWTQI